ncbi:ElaB/YgaM/YqjD family protein [Metapseudomonas furukawaii]
MHSSDNRPELGSNGFGGAVQPVSVLPEDTTSTGLSKEFHNLLADLEDLIKETTSLGAEDLAQAKDRLVARLATTRQGVETLGLSLAKQANRQAVMANDYVHAQPWKAIGVGAATAFLLGCVLARSRSRGSSGNV